MIKTPRTTAILVLGELDQCLPFGAHKLKFLAPLQSTKFLLSPKYKKVATIFLGFSYSFLYLNIFSPPPNVNLADVWYIFAAK